MARRQWAEIELPFDCRLLKLVQDEAPILADAMGYESGEQFLTDYLSLDMDLVHRVVGWLEQEKPAEAVGLQEANDQALKAEAHAQQMLTLDSPTFAKPGRPAKGPEGNPDNIRVLAQGDYGTSAGYLAARLKKAGRDDLLEQIGPGRPLLAIGLGARENERVGNDAAAQRRGAPIERDRLRLSGRHGREAQRSGPDRRDAPTTGTKTTESPRSRPGAPGPERLEATPPGPNPSPSER